MKSYSKGKSVVEIEESYHYLEENRLFIDFSFQIVSVEGILIVRHNSTLKCSRLKIQYVVFLNSEL